ncbi:hypothetical protein [Jeotgalibacillus soli]|uniref:Uncharacterized protein n=1 Tax=Jeotgalibacillus soli TaxID=889306 RepID=A0A0C2RTI4_9BACL|nr:hypothetical protein [Jeotgalibacillus soli]KIL45029.1 hypothetical protein KP78_25730 [Jeotgalibacillus soli]
MSLSNKEMAIMTTPEYQIAKRELNTFSHHFDFEFFIYYQREDEEKSSYQFHHVEIIQNPKGRKIYIFKRYKLEDGGGKFKKSASGNYVLDGRQLMIMDTEIRRYEVMDTSL